MKNPNTSRYQSRLDEKTYVVSRLELSGDDAKKYELMWQSFLAGQHVSTEYALSVERRQLTDWIHQEFAELGIELVKSDYGCNATV